MSKWISVKEELPEERNVTVLASDGYDVLPAFYTMDEWCEMDGCVTELDILFWMHLPNPPELE